MNQIELAQALANYGCELVYNQSDNVWAILVVSTEFPMRGSDMYAQHYELYEESESFDLIVESLNGVKSMYSPEPNTGAPGPQPTGAPYDLDIRSWSRAIADYGCVVVWNFNRGVFQVLNESPTVRTYIYEEYDNGSGSPDLERIFHNLRTHDPQLYDPRVPYSYA